MVILVYIAEKRQWVAAAELTCYLQITIREQSRTIYLKHFLLPTVLLIFDMDLELVGYP